MDALLDAIVNTAAKELNSKGHEVKDPRELAQYINKTKTGKLLRKRFGEKMVILTIPFAKNEKDEILRLFIGISAENEVGGVYSNYISEEQAKLLDKS